MVVHKTHSKVFAKFSHSKVFAFRTRQVIQGENFRDWLKNCENHESFPHQKFSVYGTLLHLYLAWLIVAFLVFTIVQGILLTITNTITILPEKYEDPRKLMKIDHKR